MASPSGWNWNPFIGNLQKSGISFKDIDFSQAFTIGDWVLDSDWFILVNHALDSLNPSAIIRDSDNQAMVNRIEIVDNNNIKIWVPSVPDLRFDGIISLLRG